MKKTLNKLVIKTLQLNKKRTIATIIGIILSTAMICAIAGVFSSLQQTAIQHTIEADGDYHTIFYNVPKEEQKYILENRNVESYFITQNEGHATIEEDEKDNRVYLHLKEFDEAALNNFGLILTKGRLPENNNELLISEYYLENLKNYGSNSSKNDSEQRVEEEKKSQPQNEQRSNNQPKFQNSFEDKMKSVFGDLNIDSDKALLLSLILLLSEEKADELLIMALIYMLT